MISDMADASAESWGELFFITGGELVSGLEEDLRDSCGGDVFVLVDVTSGREESSCRLGVFDGPCGKVRYFNRGSGVRGRGLG